MFVLKNLRYKNILEVGELRIHPQEITCIVGESGGGKTTLIKMLNCLISPDQGDIWYRGRNLKELDPVQLRREVVMLTQVPPVFPGSLRDNLLAGLDYSEKEPVPDPGLIRALEDMKLRKGLGEEASKLSGGEKQRLALARVLLMGPQVLLLDEPSSALDDDTEDLVLESLAHWVKTQKKSMVMVTHSKKLARTYGDTIITVDRGKILGTERGEHDGRSN